MRILVTECALCVILPLEVLHIEDRNSDSYVQDLKSDKHEIFLEGMYEWLLQIFYHVYQTESQQIFQNDCSNMDKEKTSETHTENGFVI